MANHYRIAISSFTALLPGDEIARNPRIEYPNAMRVSIQEKTSFPHWGLVTFFLGKKVTCFKERLLRLEEQARNDKMG